MKRNEVMNEYFYKIDCDSILHNFDAASIWSVLANIFVLLSCHVLYQLFKVSVDQGQWVKGNNF